MKKTLSYFATGVLCLLQSLNLYSQYFDYPYIENFGNTIEVNLSGPDPREGVQLIPTGIDLYQGNDVNTIYYGMTPPNSSSNPVVVFVHGYASHASIWYEGRDNVYKDVYGDGYRSAYVSMTPNRHMWTNGTMLSGMISQICAHYGVSDLVVVCHSKGGVDTDAAISHFGAAPQVSQVFTLASPHHGTGIAELGNSVLLSLANIIFMQDNDATKSLTRGYMSYFRSITDNLSSNTVPYTTIGSWGNGPLNRLAIPQGFLYLAGGSKASGGNDGVVPYISSTRPGGRELFDGQRKEYGWFGIPYYPGPSETELDHFEITRGDYVWPYIKAVINGNLRTSPQLTPRDYRPNQQLSSNAQIVANGAQTSRFFISDENTEPKLWLVQPQGAALPQLRSLNGQENLQLEAFVQEEVEGTIGTWYTVLNAIPGEYELTAKNDFAGLLVEENGPEMVLTMDWLGQSPAVPESAALQLEIEPLGLQPTIGLKATGTVQLIHDLNLNEVDAAPMSFQMTDQSGRFQISLPAELAPGVYHLNVNLQGETFARTISTSFAKLGAKKEALAATQIKLEAFPNPFTDRLQVQFDATEMQAPRLRITNVLGQLIEEASLEAGSVQHFSWNAQDRPAGIYLLELFDGEVSVQTEKVILQ